MEITGFTIQDIKNPNNPNEIKKVAIDNKTKDVLGTLDAEYFDGKIYSGEKFSPFYVAEKTQYSSVPKKHIYAKDLFVYRSARKKGVGTKLIQSLVKESVDRGCEGRVILLAGSNEASPLPFYKKLGFITSNNSLNARLDEAIKYKTEIDRRIQEFMFITKKEIAKMLKSIR